MKPTQITELFANIKATIVSFFSIFMFVALAVGIFAGITWAGPALQVAADRLFDEGSFHHFQVQFPYGLTDGDVGQLSETEGVQAVEPGYAANLVYDRQGRTFSVKAQSIGSQIDLLKVVEGELPSSPGEIAFVDTASDLLGVQVGDTVTFRHDVAASDQDAAAGTASQAASGEAASKDGEEGSASASSASGASASGAFSSSSASASSASSASASSASSASASSASSATAASATADSSDPDGMAQLKGDTYVVTALVQSPEYMARDSETYGFISKGSGEIDSIAWLPSEAFDPAAFMNAYPVVDVRIDGVEGLNSFSDEYDQKASVVENRIKDLGSSLADIRHDALYDEAAKKLSDGEIEFAKGEQKIADGEEELKKGKEQIAEGEEQIKKGEAELEEGKKKLAEAQEAYEKGQAELESRSEEGQRLLDEAGEKLRSGEELYAQAESALDELKRANEELQDKYAQAKSAYDSAAASYDELVAVYDGLVGEAEFDAAAWSELAGIYGELQSLNGMLRDLVIELNKAIDTARTTFTDVTITGSIPVPPELPDMPAIEDEKDLSRQISKVSSNIEQAKSSLEAARKAEIVVGDSTISFETADSIAPVASQLIADAETELENKRIELEEGRQTYEDAQTQYNDMVAEGRDRLDEAAAELAEARSKASEGEAELKNLKKKIKDGKKEIKEKSAELEDGKKQLEEKRVELENARNKLGMMKDYEWTVLGRGFNGGVAEASTLSAVTNSLSFSMAALFVIVGLLVCYSAISRIVHEQIVQVGTKKALGLRNREITLSFLAYAAIAVVAGVVVGLAVGTTVVEGIIGGVLSTFFNTGQYPPYFGLPLALVVAVVELVLILGVTWFACRSILKEQAVDLLRGEKPPEGKTRFYEKWGIWDKLPLFTQTIVNNCVNEKRRVFSTIVGIAGCTALIVTAITLNNDVLSSYDKHYDEVYGFNAIAFADPEVEGSVARVADKMKAQGAATAQVLHEKAPLTLSNGDLATATLIVPEQEDEFSQVYHLTSTSGDAVDLSADGAWVTEAYADHMGAKVGDELVVGGTDGAVHRVPILGFYRFYLTYYEIVMGREYYEREFATDLKTDAVLADTHERAVENYEPDLLEIEGFTKLLDDKTKQWGNFSTFSSVSRTVVLIYLFLSVLMAVVVLLNLNVMFIDEKKRELIVLMINGFSVKDAKRYIYNDTIVLTVLGIVVGVFAGIAMGSLTVASIEPNTASFFKGVDWIAVLAGVCGSAVLSVIMSFIALRRIPKFNLTDINKT